MRIIKVEEIGMYGFSSGTKYFKSLHKAKKYFKELVIRHNSEELVCPIKYSNNDPYGSDNTPGKRLKVAYIESYYKTENENGTEWDETVDTVVLSQIKIEGIERTKITFSFKGKNQLPLFMVIKEFYEGDEIVFAKVLFSIG